MMLDMPPTLAEADAARAPKPRAAGAEPGNAGDTAQPFALLLAAGEPVDPAAWSRLMSGAGDGAPETATEEALAAALAAAIESGKFVPPAGEFLPPGHMIRTPAGLPGDPAAPDDALLTRMIDMLRTLQGHAGQALPTGAGEMPMQPGLEMKVVEQFDSARLLSTTLGAQAQAPVSAASPATTGTTPAAATPPSVPIAVPPGRPDWSAAVGQRVLWMVSHKTQAAELRLNPPELGPVEVKVRTDEDGVRLSFAAGNAAVREALESAAPRLREMFLAEGLRLENMDIGQRHAGAGRDDGSGGIAGPDDATGEDVEAQASERSAQPQRAGLVDCFV